MREENVRLQCYMLNQNNVFDKFKNIRKVNLIEIRILINYNFTVLCLSLEYNIGHFYVN